MRHFPVGGPDPRVPDPGDKLDVAKDPRRAWDFPETKLKSYSVNGHVFRASSASAAEKLSVLRDCVDTLCTNVVSDYESWIHDDFLVKRVAMFLDIHAYGNYTLNEIPTGTRFDGINKPRGRYITSHGPGIGADSRIRASRRDIFLNLKKTRRDLDLLLVHELAHTLANHVTFREDDHHRDFVKCEKFIKKHWPRRARH